jgi:hypothetical protein
MKTGHFYGNSPLWIKKTFSMFTCDREQKDTFYLKVPTVNQIQMKKKLKNFTKVSKRSETRVKPQIVLVCKTFQKWTIGQITSATRVKPQIVLK